MQNLPRKYGCNYIGVVVVVPVLCSHKSCSPLLLCKSWKSFNFVVCYRLLCCSPCCCGSYIKQVYYQSCLFPFNIANIQVEEWIDFWMKWQKAGFEASGGILCSLRTFIVCTMSQKSSRKGCGYHPKSVFSSFLSLDCITLITKLPQFPVFDYLVENIIDYFHIQPEERLYNWT